MTWLTSDAGKPADVKVTPQSGGKISVSDKESANAAVAAIISNKYKLPDLPSRNGK